MAATKADGATGRRATRKIQWLGICVLALIAAYSALWWFLAGRLEQGAEAAIANARQNGVEIACEERDVRGYPFRLGVFCGETRAALPDGTRIEAGAFRSAAQIYRPGLVISELDAPVSVEGPGGTLDAEWASARASTRLGTEQLQLGVLEASDLALALAPAGGDALRAKADALVASIRPNGTALDAAVTLTNLDPEPVAGRDVPPVDLRLDASLTGAAEALAYGGRPLETLRGREIDLRALGLDLGEGGAVTASGTLAVDEGGLASGEVDLAFTDLAATLDAIARLVPELAPQIEAAGPLLAQAGGGLVGNLLGGGGQDMPGSDPKMTRVTIKLDGGRAMVGLFPIGVVPRLP